MSDPLLLLAAIQRFTNPPPIMVTPDNWETCRAEAYLPDHIDSWAATVEWLKNLNIVEAK